MSKAKSYKKAQQEQKRLFKDVTVGRERLKAFSRWLVEIQESERRYIARELHDQIGQLLTGLKLILEIERSAPLTKTTGNLDEALELVDELMQRVRDLSLDLRPAMLDDLGLLHTLLWYFERYTTQTQIRVNFKYVGLEKRFDPDIETAAYRILQEALTNVARHAQVEEVLVRVWVDQDMLILQTTDEGTDLKAETIEEIGVSSGLTGIRERTFLLGGQLTIDSTPGQGTRLTAKLPLKT